jgi:hypothetical protein
LFIPAPVLGIFAQRGLKTMLIGASVIIFAAFL